MDATSGAKLRVTLCVGNYTFSIDGLSGHEALNEPYHFKLYLRPTQVLDDTVFLNQTAQLIFEQTQPLEPSTGFSPTRTLSGKMTQHRLINPYTSQSVLTELVFEPMMALCKLSGKPRVYTQMTALELVFLILKKQGYQAHQLNCDNLDTNHSVYPHWVQAENETDFEFIHRVLSREGISYFWGNPNEQGEEMMYFHENHFLHPHHEGYLKLQEDCGLTGPTSGYIFNTSIIDKPQSYHIQYFDFNAQNPSQILKAHYGQGTRSVKVWGYGAHSYEDLQRAARHHHERLVMKNKILTAKTHNASLCVGHMFSIFGLPKIIESHGFHLLRVMHHLKKGAYYNEIECIPKLTPVRPPQVKRLAGQTIHTAVIHSEDEFPYLDRSGNYTFSTHVHQNNPYPNEHMKAARITPFGGRSTLNQAMGMHFPLKNQAEVLVMYLHNDFNQPILQNSPDNGINHPPVTRDNSWNNLIKTAWGQYLSFSDQKGKEEITLAGQHAHNRLVLSHHNNQLPDVSLISQRGQLTLQAKEAISFDSKKLIQVQAHEAFTLDSQKKIDIQAESIHQQAHEIQMNGHEHFRAKATGHGEMNAQNIEIHAQDKLAIIAKGQPIQVELPNGDIEWEVDELTITAIDQIKLISQDAAITLNRSGITFCGETIQFAGGLDLRAPLVENNSPVPPLVTTIPTPGPFVRAKRYPFQTTQVINPPNWSQSFHFAEDIATIEVDFRGFSGSESGKVLIARYARKEKNDMLPVFPAKRLIAESDVIDTFDFKLGKDGLYPNKKQLQDTPGSAKINIDYPIERLISKLKQEKNWEHHAYYARIEIGDVNGEFYSGPLLIISAANIKIVTDRNLPYQTQEAILGLLRNLPENLKAHRNCPSPQELKYYRDKNRFKTLVIGNSNQISLFEHGVYRELLSEDKTLPLPKQTFKVDEQADKEILLTRLMPPMIFDLRQAEMKQGKVLFREESPDARIELTDDEISYIKNNGNNLTLFIHGYNVELGTFDHHFTNLYDKDIHQVKSYGLTPVNSTQTVIEKTVSDVPSTIFRDEAFFRAQFPEFFKTKHSKSQIRALESYNGEGVCEWITHLERHLNQAAGFDGKDYSLFTRCLFINWPGAPEKAYDYMQAVKASIRMGEIVAQAIMNIKSQIPDLKLHIIAHSQGNGVMLHALEKLGEAQRSLVDHAIFWQAAIPSDALSDRNLGNQPVNEEAIAKAQEKNPWYCPYAHRGAKKFTVLYSKNDNVLGHLIPQKEQPDGVSLKEVWRAKPWEELKHALMITTLSLESLYSAATQLNASISDLFNESKLEGEWKKWRSTHLTFYCSKNQTYYRCAETLEDQYQLLKSIGHDGIFSHEFKMNLKNGVKNLQTLLIDYSPIPPALVKAIGHLTKFIDSTKNISFVYEKINHIIDIHKIFPYKNSLGFTELGNKGTKMIEHHSPTIAHLLTYVQTTMVMNPKKAKPAMGYEGPDLSDQFINHLKNSDRLIPEETTKWLWEHSHMKRSNKEIMKNIYKKFIINRTKGINGFGLYEDF